MNATILQLRCNEAFIESCAAIVFSEECTWYNGSTIFRRCRKEGTIESRVTILFLKDYPWYNGSTIFRRCLFAPSLLGRQNGQRSEWSERRSIAQAIRCRKEKTQI